jgi:glycolate oxidase iron-sulfur subunit
MSALKDFERSIERCVRCGFCLTVCPTYTLQNAEESSPRGRIALAKAVIEGEVAPSLTSLATFNECVGCRACESACPSGVVYEEVLLYGRAALADAGFTLPWHARALLFTIKSPIRLALAQRLWRLAGALAIRAGRLLRTARPPFGMLGALPSPSREHAPQHPGAEVAIHRGCLMDIFWEGTNQRAALLLGRTGADAQLLPLTTGCCGALHAHQGDQETARQLARRVIAAFEESGAETLVSLAGGCGAFLAGYPHLFAADDPWRARAERLAGAVRDIASLLVERGYQPATTKERTTYQDSCHLRHGMGVWREPRRLLQQSSDYSEMLSADQCCGSAGIYNLLRPDIAGRMLQDKVTEVSWMTPDLVVTSNPGCELQWRMGVRQAGLPIRVCHLVDYLFEHQNGSDIDYSRSSALRGRGVGRPDGGVTNAG